jgi:hypothetical protein
MTPIGFSIENFDAIRQWRTTDGVDPIDATGYLLDGTKLDGVKGMREALLRYSLRFVRVMTERLMIYAREERTVPDEYENAIRLAATAGRSRGFAPQN